MGDLGLPSHINIILVLFSLPCKVHISSVFLYGEVGTCPFGELHT